MRTFLRRSALVLGGLAFTAIVVVWAGTFAATRVSGDLFGPCQRALSGDDSDQQSGHASMHWFPPRVHCEYPADPLAGISAATEDHDAGVMIFVAFGGAALVLMYALANIWVNAPVSDPDSR